MPQPHHRDHDDGGEPTKRSASTRSKTIAAGIALCLVVVVALHIAGVFGP